MADERFRGWGSDDEGRDECRVIVDHDLADEVYVPCSACGLPVPALTVATFGSAEVRYLPGEHRGCPGL